MYNVNPGTPTFDLCGGRYMMYNLFIHGKEVRLVW